MTLTARPTLYNGVQMRSRLEAGFAAWLDRNKFTCQYEPGAFANQHGQYLPDFRIESLSIVAGQMHVLAEPAYIEIKPDELVDRQRIDQQFRTIIDTDHYAIPILVTEKHTTLWLVGHWYPSMWTMGDGQPRLAICRPQDQPFDGEWWRQQPAPPPTPTPTPTRAASQPSGPITWEEIMAAVGWINDGRDYPQAYKNSDAWHNPTDPREYAWPLYGNPQQPYAGDTLVIEGPREGSVNAFDFVCRALNLTPDEGSKFVRRKGWIERGWLDL